MKRKWWLLGLAVVLVLGSGAGWYVIQGDTEGVASASVITTQVRSGSIQLLISGSGSLEPVTRETIKPTETGEVAEVLYADGDLVKAGEPLITFVAEDIQDQLDTYELDLKIGQLDLEQLQTEYKQAADDEAREAVQVTIEKKLLDLERIREDIAELESSQGKDPIVAPIDGVLTGFDVEAGETIASNTSLGDVVNYAQLKVTVSVDELDISKVVLDQTATITVEALSGSVFSGKVIDIADEGIVNNGVASFDVTVLLDEASGLKTGMSAEVAILTASSENTLLLQASALQSMRGQSYVLVPAEETEASTAPEEAGAAQRPSGDWAPPEGTTGSQDSGRPEGMVPPEGMTPPAEQASPEGETMTEAQQGADVQGRRTGRTPEAGGFASNLAPEGQEVVMVEVGIQNESFVEILSGLSEGDEVIVPVTTSTSTQTQQGFTGGAIPGVGAFGGGGGGFPTGGGGNFGGGGGRR